MENYDTCPSFVYATFVWDMKHLGTTIMCPIKAIMLAIVWHNIYLNNTPLLSKNKKIKIKIKDKTFGTTKRDVISFCTILAFGSWNLLGSLEHNSNKAKPVSH